MQQIVTNIIYYMKLKLHLFKAFLCLMALAIQGAWATSTDKKIVVISDPHVMAPELLVSEGTAWTTYLDGQRKMVDYSKPLFDEMIKKIKDDIQPNLVLITGDLTKDGEQLSHTYVIGKLEELRTEGIPTLVIPGNHDRGSNSNAVYYDGASTSPAVVADNAWFATQYANYGYGTNSTRYGSTLTYACEPITGLVVIGIDSGTDGTVSTETLTWINEKALEAKAAGKRVIAMMHHPLIPHVTNAESLVPSYVVNNHDAVRKVLIDAGIRVIFTGHFHTSDIAKDFYDDDDLTRCIYDVNTGSLISYPCDYREVTISGDLSEMNLTMGHITSLTSDATFSADYSRNRLHASVKKIVSDKAKAKYGAGLAAMMATQIASMAGKVADAYIIHANGNENEVNTDDIIEALSAAFALMPETEAMCKSMLYDKAPYGFEGRENQTNDLTLDVELPVSIKLANDGYSTYCSENKLDISKTDGLTAYIVTGVSASTVTLSSVNVIPANTGFVIKGTGAAIYDLYKSTGDADDVSGNKLHGTLVATNAPANTFVLSTMNTVTGFYPADTGITIPAHKAYLTISGGVASARTIDFSGGTTGIEGVKGLELDGEFYNLQGMKVANPRKGVYVNHGKLVFIK